MNPGELETLIGLIKTVEAPRSIVEFGVNEGRTAKAILREIPGIRSYVGVDVVADYIPSKTVQRNEVPAHPGHMVANDKRFSLIVRRRGSLDLTANDLPAADAIFIDGDHGRETVIHDTALARAIARPGGIIIWHDFHDLGTVDVREVLHEFADLGQIITHVAGTWLAFERR
jgi:predicted O-methyltransferase YrrM